MDATVPVSEQPTPPTEPVQTPVQLPEVSVEAPASTTPVQAAPEAVTAQTVPAPTPEPVPAPIVEKPGAVQAPEKPSPKNPAGVPVEPGAVPEKKKSAAELMAPPIIIGPAPVPVSNARWETDLEQSAASTGVDPDLMRRIAGKESTNDPNARARTSTAAGIFQITSGTWNDLRVRYPQLNLTNRLDPAQQARVAPYYMREIQENLQRVIGRKPNAAESYLGWFLGPTDAALAMKANPDTPVEAILDSKSIAANPAVFGKARTIGQLYSWASGKMGEGADATHPKPALDLTPYLAEGHDRSHIDKMDWDLKSRLANMVAEMPENLRAKFQINSGFRSPERQAELFQQAVAKYGSEAAARKWVAPPGNSMHNHGKAADLNMNGDPELKTWLHENAAKYGLGFPMAHEPWHIEALGARETKIARMGMRADPSVTNTQMRVPFSAADDVERHRQKEKDAYGLVQAGIASAQQDWMVANLLKMNGRQAYDPGFTVTQDTFHRDDIKALPERYLPYVGKALSEQDLDFRVREAAKDAERERRLQATGGSTLLRLAVGMADPANLALSVVAPVGLGAKVAQVGRIGRIAAAAADGAIGGLAGDVPNMLGKPGYEAHEAIWAGAMGTAGYLALNRHAWAPHVREEMEQAVGGLTKLKTELENSTTPMFGDSSAGAAQAPYRGVERDPVREDIGGFFGLNPERSGAAWMDKVRFDSAKMKNSQNPGVATLTDALVQDPIGNRNKNVAVTIPAEAIARQLETKANLAVAREYKVAAHDFQKRNGISEYDWQFGGKEVEFQELITHAVRNDDPQVKFDPAVQKMAGVVADNFESFRQHALNPGKIRGETMPAIPGAESWEASRNYMPRYVDWEAFRAHNAEFGNELKNLFGDAIARKNPDLDPMLAIKVGDSMYKRLAGVAAGQEEHVANIYSGTDLDLFRRELSSQGFSGEDIEKVLYSVGDRQSGEKTMTSRQKRRTLLDENFSTQLRGENGVRDVKISDLWDNNVLSNTQRYAKQMSGTIALAGVRIKNPDFHPTKNPSVPQFLVDGIHSEGDIEKLFAQLKAVDAEIRPADGGKVIDGEVKQLQWIFDTIRGIPQESDRSKLGQATRILQNYNFIRLMSQAGMSSIAEFGNLLGLVGVKHMAFNIPGFRDFIRDAKTGKLLAHEMEDLEYAFTAGTDHIRGEGMTWQARSYETTAAGGSAMSGFLDKWEQRTKRASRITSAITLAPITAFQERMAVKSIMAKLRGVALNGEKVNDQRMRVIGFSGDDIEKISDQIRKHHDVVKSADGRDVKILGLDKWEPQIRSKFELGINTFVRRAIQQNDIGQMNRVMSSPMAKMLTQFRTFTLGAWSKQTLSSIHMADKEALTGFLASMVFGSMAYIVQSHFNGIGLTGADKEKFDKDRLSYKKIAGAAFQRAGASSIMPGILDFGWTALGQDPLFDTRSTQQASSGLLSNPSFGVLDAVHGAAKQIGKSTLGDDSFTSGDARTVSRAINVFHNYPLMQQFINASSQLRPPE